MANVIPIDSKSCAEERIPSQECSETQPFVGGTVLSWPPSHSSFAERANVLSKPPHEPWKGKNMARARYQKGTLKKIKTGWRLVYREDALDAQGNIVRLRRTVRIGDAQLSKKEAR